MPPCFIHPLATLLYLNERSENELDTQHPRWCIKITNVCLFTDQSHTTNCLSRSSGH